MAMTLGVHGPQSVDAEDHCWLAHVREGRAHEGEEHRRGVPAAQQIGHAGREVRAGMASDGTRLFFRA